MKFEIGNLKLVLMTIILASVFFATQKVSAETVAYWRLEEGASGTSHPTDLDGFLKDSSGYSNHMSRWYFPGPAIDLPAATIPQTGAENERSLSFCKTDNTNPNLMFIATDSNKPIDSIVFSNGFTIECAAKDLSYQWNAVINKDGKPSPTSDGNPFKLLFRYDGHPNPRLGYEFMDGASNVHGLYPTSFSYQLDKWYWVACVSDGSQAWLYIKQEGDANYDLEAHVTGVTDGMIDHLNAWAIGRGCWAGNPRVDGFNGRVDEVRICDYALAPDQFLAASGGVAVSPVAYWRFEEGTNGVHQVNNDDHYVDSSGNGNHMSTININPAELSTASTDVPFDPVPQILEANTKSRTFTAAIQNVGTFGPESGGNTIDSLPLTTFTIECMAKPSAIGWEVAVCKDGNPGWARPADNWPDMTAGIKFRADSKINFLFWDENTNLLYLESISNYEIDKWHQVAAVFDGTEARLYIKKEGDSDYTLDNSTTTSWSPGNPPISSGGMIKTTRPWVIGRGMHEGRQIDGFAGEIDEVRISNTALDPSKFLGNIMNTNPVPPVFNNISITPGTPSEKDEATVQATITTANSTITNAALEYSINGGGYVSVNMVTNTSPSIYSGIISSQIIDTVVDFRIKAVNGGGQTAYSSTSSYEVVQSIEWATIIVANDTVVGDQRTGMDIAPNGLAGFVYRQGNDGARYVEETSRGILSAPVEITTNIQGFFSTLKFGEDGIPRVSLSYDVDNEGGVSYVQRNSGVWADPITVVSTSYSYVENDRRHVMTLVDDVPSVLWYESVTAKGQTPLGLLCDGNTAGDAFTSVEVNVPPFPNYPGDLHCPFEMVTGSDGKRHITIAGSGYGDDLLYYGVESSKGSGTFNWEEVQISLTHSNVFADRIGFALDNNNNPYIVLRDYNVNPVCAALFYKESGTWHRKYFSPQGHWNRAKITYDPYNDCMWAVHNSAGDGGDLIYFWSNRSGSWKQEQTLPYEDFVEAFAGFRVTEEGVIKLAFTPSVSSSELVYMHTTTFSDVPEPAIIFAGIALALLAFRRK